MIDSQKWDAAQWKGVAFLLDPTGLTPPCLGLVFQDIAAGRAIFRDWINQLGSTDTLEEIRIAIVEGAIRGEDPGYFIHLCPAGNGVTAGRVCRMSPAKDSTHLAQFKANLEQHHHYILVAVSTGIEPQFDCAIQKSEIHSRRISHLTPSDLDAVVLPAGYFEDVK